MAKKRIVIDEKCPACNGTGIFVGMAEKDGAGVVCHKCNGTGCFRFVHEYEEFEKREERIGIRRVFETNPGIMIGENEHLGLKDFGGVSYRDWLDGKPFPDKSEMRKFTCPAWWYQCVHNYLRPHWDECYSALGGRYSDCKHFADKEKCWERFDKERGERSGEKG